MQRQFLNATLLGMLSIFTLSGCNPVSTVHAKDSPPATARVEAVLSVGMTVHDMDRSVEFYSKVLSFEKGSDIELAGTEHERLTGVFGLRMRVVRMTLGEEFLDLTEFLAPCGRP